jgi:hypothetical protein
VDAVRLPEDLALIDLLKKISLSGVVLTLALTVITFTGFWGISPHISSLFLITGLALSVRPTENMTKIIKYIFINTPLLGGILLFVWSLINILLNYYRIDNTTNISFMLLGLTLVIPYATFLNHRFHPTQFLAFLILMINIQPVLVFIYSLFTPAARVQVTISSFFTSLIFSLIACSIVLRWPGRGFVGYLTTKSVSGSLARRIILINMLIIPVIGFLGIYFNFVVILVVLIAITTVLFWLNVKFLYHSELENFLINTELKKHNVNLKLSNEDLAGKIQDLEKTGKHYRENLVYQEKFRDIAEALG